MKRNSFPQKSASPARLWRGASLALICLLACLAAACSAPAALPSPTPLPLTATLTPLPTATFTPSPTATLTPTSTPLGGVPDPGQDSLVDGLVYPRGGPFGSLRSAFESANPGYELLAVPGGTFQERKHFLDPAEGQKVFVGAMPCDEDIASALGLYPGKDGLVSGQTRWGTIIRSGPGQYQLKDKNDQLLGVAITFSQGFPVISEHNGKLWLSDVNGETYKVVNDPKTSHELFQTPQQIADHWGYSGSRFSSLGKVISVQMETIGNKLTGRLLVTAEKGTVALKMIGVGKYSESAVISERSIVQISPDKLTQKDLGELAKMLGYENAKELSINSEFGVVEGNIGNGGPEGVAYYDYQKGEWKGTQELKKLILQKSLPSGPGFENYKNIRVGGDDFGNICAVLFPDGVMVPMNKEVRSNIVNLIVTQGIRGWEVNTTNQMTWIVIPVFAELQDGSNRYLDIRAHNKRELLSRGQYLQEVQRGSHLKTGKHFVTTVRKILADVNLVKGSNIELIYGLRNEFIVDQQYIRDIESFLVNGEVDSHFLFTFFSGQL